MTIEQIVNLGNLEKTVKNGIFFNNLGDNNIKALKDYIESFLFYCKNPYSSYKMFKLLPLEIQLFQKLLKYHKASYEMYGKIEIYNIINNLSEKLINKSLTIINLIENNSL